MRRDQFIKSVLALAAGSSLSLPSLAAANIKMMIPANPGGGWDTTGRALGKALQDSGVASSVAYENKGGAAGIIGLAPIRQRHQRRRQLLDGHGRCHVGRHYHWQAPSQP